MLTETQYKELFRYRDKDIPYDGVQTETTKLFARKKYIVKYHPIMPDGQISETVMCAITEPGRQALEEFEEYAEKERDARAREDADQKEQDAKDVVDAHEKFMRDIAVAVIGSTVAGIILLVIQNWPSIVSFFANLFQK